MNKFIAISHDISTLVIKWEKKFADLSQDKVSLPRNTQNRNIRQIIGHMIDSASNNTHRIIHLQYQESPLSFPDYANMGNNDRWIAIQNYEEESWDILVQLWKYSHLHICHLIENVDPSKLKNIWISAFGDEITLEDMIVDFPRHFKLHLSEINDLINL